MRFHRRVSGDSICAGGANGERVQVDGGGAIEIDSVEQWFRVAPPARGERHWVDGRSAKELAKAWFQSGRAAAPVELVSLLASSPVTSGTRPTLGLAEHQTRFDDLPGGPRHHDLLLVLREGERVVVAGVEAKAGESLDQTVIKKREDGLALRARGESTNRPERVDRLLMALLGRSLDQEPRLGNLRYQLLTAAAGTLVEAQERGAHAALLIIHDLAPTRGTPDGLTPTQLAVSDFVTELARDGQPHHTTGVVHGPLTVPGGGRIPSTIPLYVSLIERAYQDRGGRSPA